MQGSNALLWFVSQPFVANKLYARQDLNLSAFYTSADIAAAADWHP